MNNFEEFTMHLIKDEKPSEYFNNLVKNEAYPNRYPYEVLLKLKEIDQNPKYHPEGNVWIHTMMVVDEAAKRRNLSNNIKGFMWAALLHDIGKLTTTKVRRGWITSYNHDKAGSEMVKEFMDYWGINEKEEFYKYVVNLVRLHMQILFIVKDNEFADYNMVMKSGVAKDIALLGICDRLGRGPKTIEEIEREEKNIEIFLERCKTYIEKRKHMERKYNIPSHK